jgi:DNA-directed RNA polymerase specialized sigma subunit
MAKKNMSKQEYDDQQYKYHHSLIDPSLLASVVDASHYSEDAEDENNKEIRHQLKDKLIKLIMVKVKTELTDRQQEAINLFLLQKKQEHMGSILGVSQEAANVRLKLGFKRLKKSCSNDSEIQKILADLKSL